MRVTPEVERQLHRARSAAWGMLADACGTIFWLAGAAASSLDRRAALATVRADVCDEDAVDALLEDDE